MNKPELFRIVKVLCAGFLPLVMLLSVSGCAPGLKLEPKAAPVVPAVAVGPRVESLEDGRKGFILSESVSLDEEMRRDFDQAVMHLNAQEYEQAITFLQLLVEMSPEVSALRIDLAIAYRKTGKQDLAEEQLKYALKLFPGHPVASNEYGLLLRKAGSFVDARNIYEQALTDFPDYLPVRRNLGILCDLYMNDPECALAQFEQYSADDPGDEQVSLWISELRLRTAP